MSDLRIYNTISKTKELFEPINPPKVGLYVCGPTVYGDAHLGHARPAITFDVVYRYLLYLKHKVRYVRNITDVGHLESDADEGEDKIAKRARLEEIEPMEVAQQYTISYHKNMGQLNALPPSIEPRASGHIIEQINMVEQILDAGFAYESNGSVYFDVMKYSKTNNYGKLSGRILDELMNVSRELEGSDEKRNPVDFALWKKASEGHIMKWPSPWSVGYPGWHLECSTMSTKYLGSTFDIHGGGMDLLFPHHECEIAQSKAAVGSEPVKYWMHNNMVTVNGQKMGKSLGNFITLDQFFTGEHKLLDQAYSPMTVRFFMLMSHYRSPLDFSNNALQAAEKGCQRLMNAMGVVHDLVHPGDAGSFEGNLDNELQEMCSKCHDYMNDDFNTAQVLAQLFDISTKVFSFRGQQIPLSAISADTLELVKKTMMEFIVNILGLNPEISNEGPVNGLMDLIITLRNESRAKKDYETSDTIRDKLNELGIEIKDEQDSTTWTTKLS